MIERHDLEGFARLRRLSLGNAEKDYLLDVALLSVSASTKNELVFKGGTCLYKFHKLPRFSEDLDFTATQNLDIEGTINALLADFARFGMVARLQERRTAHHSLSAAIRIEGPLFAGQAMTSAKISVDINLKSTVLLAPEALTYHSPYPEIPPFTLLCMKAEEILAEKMRALMTRTRARDLFDLHVLLKNGVALDPSLIGKKMEYYHEVFKVAYFTKRLTLFKTLWAKELRGFTQTLPPFDEVRSYVEERVRRTSA